MPYIKREEFEALKNAGRSMSNWLYNLRQRDYFKDYATDMKKMVEEWDGAIQHIHRTGKESQ